MVLVASVVIGVSTTWHRVKLNDHLEVVLFRPVRSLFELVVLVQRYVRLVTPRTNTPVRERDTHMVQTVRGDLLKVLFGDKVVVVILQDLFGLLFRHILAKRPLVNHAVITSFFVD